jgi:seryl-tRNA synthetase
VAVGRTIIALLENGQDDAGAVTLPGALAPYGAPERIEAAGG